jgi:hypothetical protein
MRKIAICMLALGFFVGAGLFLTADRAEAVNQVPLTLTPTSWSVLCTTFMNCGAPLVDLAAFSIDFSPTGIDGWMYSRVYPGIGPAAGFNVYVYQVDRTREIDPFAEFEIGDISKDWCCFNITDTVVGLGNSAEVSLGLPLASGDADGDFVHDSFDAGQPLGTHLAQRGPVSNMSFATVANEGGSGAAVGESFQWDLGHRPTGTGMLVGDTSPAWVLFSRGGPVIGTPNLRDTGEETSTRAWDPQRVGVPEPGSVMLLGTALLLLVPMKRKLAARIV